MKEMIDIILRTDAKIGTEHVKLAVREYLKKHNIPYDYCSARVEY